MNQPVEDGAPRPVPPRAKQAPVRKVAKARVARVQPEVRAEAPVQRTNPRPAPRAEGTRDTARETTRRGAVVAVGHNGERLTRRRTATVDKFEVPAHFIPPGWSYQWNQVTVLNQGIQEIIKGDLQMFENGWRPVPASRHPGHWTPPEYDGAIVIEGLRLEERPASLTMEAMEEDKQRAKAQVRDRTDALRMTQAQLPGAGVARSRNNFAGPSMGMRMSIDPGLDIPTPEYPTEEEGD